MSDPICMHGRKGIVTSHPPRLSAWKPSEPGAHAATDVCDRAECIDNAKQWVERISGKQAHHVVDGAS